MVDRPVDTADRRWQYFLLAFCAFALLAAIVHSADVVGLGSRPWYGWWDANASMSGRPYFIKIAQPRPGGASARGGLRDGDLIDLRQHDLKTRLHVLYQPLATQPDVLTVHRGKTSVVARVFSSTTAEGAALWKFPAVFDRSIASLCFIACACLIALRRWRSREARMLAGVLLCIVLMTVDGSGVVVPNSAMNLVFMFLGRLGPAVASILLVKLSSEFGTRSALRTILERTAYVAIGAGLLCDVAALVGAVTLWFDPSVFVFRISAMRGFVDIAQMFLVTLCAFAAVRSSAQSARARAAWLLLPLPIVLLMFAAGLVFAALLKSWFVNVSVVLASEGLILLSAVTVTYALLKRRVLDFEFVVGRTLVVTTVSLIVVAAFVLLEWVLGAVVTNVSHATGLIANAGLALLLGLSLRAIHKRVDAFVDMTLFRKRHEDERALLDFAKEAQFVTDPAALLDHTIQKIRRHTDAHNGALLLDGSAAYAPVRSFGDVPREIDENDEAILALKTWHKAIDPHQYESSLRGALAVPMLARGRLVGVVVLGERASGEAYAPDEVEALSQFAQGVGMSLDGLATKTSSDGLRERLELILEEVRALRMGSR
jgi:GAF domain